MLKSDGCNKLMCKCGTAICYICRMNITKSGYNHFCNHFRENAGPCNQCNRCDLWKSPSDLKAIDEAVRIATEKFNKEKSV